MAIESPLFQSSMELLGHSITHFNGTSELDRKLVILHITNAVELLLKDIVLDSGCSIYKNPKETITLQACIENLNNKGITIPYLNRLELLIDERNALQHRFGSPNELTSIFYMNVAKQFFEATLSQHYGQDFSELLLQFTNQKDLAIFKMRDPADDSELEELKKLAKLHPLGAFLSVVAYLEKTVLNFNLKVGINIINPTSTVISWRHMESNGITLPYELRDSMDEIRRLRNAAAHGKADPTEKDVNCAITATEHLERHFASLNLEEVKVNVSEAQKRKDALRPHYQANRVLLSTDQLMQEVIRDVLAKEELLGDRKFMLEVKENRVRLSHLPKPPATECKVTEYTFRLELATDNVRDEAYRIKALILKDCFPDH
jgi:hypothetical protein